MDPAVNRCFVRSTPTTRVRAVSIGEGGKNFAVAIECGSFPDMERQSTHPPAQRCHDADRKGPLREAPLPISAQLAIDGQAEKRADPGKLERGQGHENARGDPPALRGQPRRREEPAPLPEEERGGEQDGAGERADYRQEPEVERLTRSGQERAQPPR